MENTARAPQSRTAATAGLLLLAACSSSPPKAGLPAPVQVPVPARSDTAASASFDWHPLAVAPFGTLLRDIPIRLHEVLLFHSLSPGPAPAEAESGDCYTADGPPPKFVGHAPDEFLLCFEHDRLHRIEAAVRISDEDAASTFGRACLFWSKNAPPRAVAADACEGRDGDVAFIARLEAFPEEHAAELHMTLSSAAGEAEGEPFSDPAATSAPPP